MKKINTTIIFVTILSITISIFYFKNNNYIIKNNMQAQENTNLEKDTDQKQKIEYKIISFGDSLTAGYGLNLEDSYPMQLEKKLLEQKYKVKIINAGVSGETSMGNLERAEFIRTQNPDIVILGIGGNDALRGLNINDTKENIENTIKILQSGSNPTKVILLQIQSPNNLGIKYKKEFDAIYQSVSKNKSVPLVPFVVDEVFLSPKYMLGDGIHPNAEGYKILIDKYINPEVLKFLVK
jgi:acyl-CoA thioesterase-1